MMLIIIQSLPSFIYRELLLWWSQFRESFATEILTNWKNIIWNNKEIRIDKKPIYYENYIESGTDYLHP